MTILTWKNSASLLPTFTPNQIIPNYTSVGQLLNHTVYHTEIVIEKNPKTITD